MSSPFLSKHQEFKLNSAINLSHDGHVLTVLEGMDKSILSKGDLSEKALLANSAPSIISSSEMT